MSAVTPILAVAPKFCVDCKHVKLSTLGNDFHGCTYTYPGQFNLVTGEGLKQEYDYCSTLRKSTDPRICGAEARFFEFACDCCGGSGFRTVQYGGDDSGYGAAAALCDADDQPCPECNANYSRVPVAP
jgi:hypothetical protein